VVYNDVLKLCEHGHDVWLLWMALIGADADPTPMQWICPTQYFPKAPAARWWRVLTNVGNRLPFAVVRYIDKRLLNAAREIPRKEKIDIILLEQAAMGTYGRPLREEFGVPFFVRGHNVDTQVFAPLCRGTAQPVRAAGRPLAAAQMQRIQA